MADGNERRDYAVETKDTAGDGRQTVRSGARDPLLGTLVLGDLSQRYTDFNYLPGREPVMLAITFYDPAEPESFRLSNHGGCVLGPGHARARHSLLRLVLDSAALLDHRIPEMFTPDAAEVFYSGGRLEEVRLLGRRVSGTDLEGNVQYSREATAEPAFGRGQQGEIVLAPQDSGRRHVAFKREGNSLVVSWDLRGHGEGTISLEAYYDILLVEVGTGAGTAQEAERGGASAPTAEQLRGQDAKGLRKMLLHRQPVEIREPRVIEVSEAFRKLTYVIDGAEARAQLAQRYASSADFSDHEINKVAREEGVTRDEAKAMLFLDHTRARDEFVEKNQGRYFERAAAVLRDAFDKWLVSEVNTLALADWDRPGIEKSKSPDQIRKELRSDNDDSTAKRIGMRRPGRAAGERPRMRKEKRRARDRERLGRIKAAMASVIERELKVKELNAQAIGAAEDAVTAEAVMRELGISIETLRRWLRQCRVGFGDVKDEVVLEKVPRCGDGAEATRRGGQE